MSDKKKNKKVKNVIRSSSAHAVLKISAGLVLLTVGIGFLIGTVLPSGSVFQPMREAALTLFGKAAGFLSPLFIWAGVLVLASAYHPVSFRGCLLAAAAAVLICAVIDLLTPTTGPGKYHVESVIMSGNYWSALITAGTNGKNVLGCGALAMAVAYPLGTLGTAFGVAVGIVLILVCLFAFLRCSPVKLFSRISDLLEARRVKKNEQAAMDEPVYAEDEPAADGRTRQNIRNGYTSTASFVPSAAPRFSGPAAVPARVRDEYAFEDGMPDMPGDAPVPDQYESGNAVPFTPAGLPRDAYARRGVSVPGAEQTAQPALRGGYAGEEFYPVPEEEEIPAYEDTCRPVSAPARAAAAAHTERRSAASVPAGGNVKQTTQSMAPRRTAAKRPAEEEEKQVWDVEEDAVEVIAPAVKAEAPKSAAGTPEAFETSPARDETASREKELVPDEKKEPAPRMAADPAGWADLTSRARRQLDKPKMAMDDKPKPVYTDAAVPLTGEKVEIVTQTHGVISKDAGIDGRDSQKAGIQIEMNITEPYNPPPITLLTVPRVSVNSGNAAEDESRANKIVYTLASFKVPCEMKQIIHGPAITRFAIQIDPGVRVGQVLAAEKNLALDLGNSLIRIESPIQGTNYIGIEVPNQKVTPVVLREVLDSDEMRNDPNPLVVALGKDIAGTPVTCDLSKMPHLLIAGATGSGKSVCINSIVCSLIYRARPKDVRLIMVDPKQVELQVYNGIPHLLTPVVSDPRKAAGVLNWVVNEMTERYSKFAANKVRNLNGYNKLKEGTEEEMPNIVVIIDEMADLMDTCKKDVEEYIRRLAALARAAGIYMVLATQRPSVDVITGVIKNNIPSRIAFMVSSGTDSRTIIDQNGAEKLVGRGDMLYKPAGAQNPRRVQGCFVSDGEVEAIAQYVSDRYETNYDVNIQEQLDNINEQPDEDEGPGRDLITDDDSDGSLDEMLEKAIEIAVEDEQASTSMLQRRLRVGYARAGRLIDEMEKRGIISKAEGSKPRKTLMTRQQYYEMTGKEILGDD